VPSLWQSFGAVGKLFGQGNFWLSFLFTFLRTLGALALSYFLALCCVAISVVSPTGKRVLFTIVSVLRTLPTLAVTLMLLIWTSPSVAPIVVAVLVLFPMIYAQFLAAIASIDSNLLEMAKVYRLTKKQKLFQICLPQVAPAVLGQVGANFSLGIKLMVSAEVLAYTNKSLGGMMQQAKLYAEMPRFAALILVCIVLGLVVEWLCSLLSHLTDKWHKGEASPAENPYSIYKKSTQTNSQSREESHGKS
jgi:NitT/TauT family transport system permease protein